MEQNATAREAIRRFRRCLERLGSHVDNALAEIDELDLINIADWGDVGRYAKISELARGMVESLEEV
jgi:hypothetical protein